MSFFNKISNRFSSSEGEYSSTSSSRAPGSSVRRREQVRRAQKTHRERKAEYVRALEAEVAALRARDSQAVTDLRRQSVITDRLRSLLTANNIIIPPELEHVDDYALNTDIEILGAAGNPQRLHLTHSAATSPTSLPPPDAVVDFDDPRIAIDFILALEQPCLLHFHNTPEPIEGVGHTLQLQASVVDTSPATVPTAGKQYFAPGSTWTVSGVQLQRQVDRLLITSSQLPLDGEMTPVMCWMAIKDHPQNARITKSKLDRIQWDLVLLIACYGFGAIVDQGTFYNKLNTVLQAP